MRNVGKKLRNWGILLLMVLCVAGAATAVSSKNVQAATKTGFQTINGKTYYIRSDGTKQKGWLTLKGKKYYFNTKTGVQQKGWLTDSKGRKYYFTSKAGVMVTGWLANSKGQRRYFDKTTGVMKTGWLTLSGKKYYLYSKSGVAATGWLTDSKKQKRYFNKSTGAMTTGWATISKKKYYFNTSTGAAKTGWMTLSGKKYYFDSAGVMKTGWLTLSGKKYYFYSGSGAAATGWLKDSKGNKRYFDSSTCVMATGFKTLSGATYYFYSGSGVMATGWLTDSKGNKRYFGTDGKMATGDKTIDGKEYTFGSDGIMIVNTNTGGNITQPSSARTIKNYLLGALQPVGRALYVWGGGWNDSTRKGVSPTWQEWYNSQTSSYDFNNYRDLSTANRAKGLDCSGFVGWAAYQVMQTKSGVGSGYTVVSGEVGSYYKSLGWGTTLTQSTLSGSGWKLQPGDVGYNSGHTWIVLGQCADKSVVIVHSTPQAGCQISGTPTPSGDYSSQAITLAKQYMSKFSGYTKYDYHPSSGNYIRNGNYFRWNRSTLADPDGYTNMTADQILRDLFSGN